MPREADIDERQPSGSTEGQAGDYAREIATTQRRGPWRRFWAWLRDFEEAMDTTYDDVQDRRIAALEAEVAHLRAPVADEK